MTHAALSIRIRSSLVVASALLLNTGCDRTHVPPYSNTEELQFRASEAKDLASPRGDLAKLRTVPVEGPTSIGGNGSGGIQLASWQGEPLEITPQGNQVAVKKAGPETRLDGMPLLPGQVIPFASGEASGWITHGSISMLLKKDKHGPWFQVFDSTWEPLRTLHALNYYPPSPRYRVAAEWIPVARGHPLTYHRTNGGSDLDETAPGYVQFSLDSKPYRLYATIYPDMLYIVFRDLTSKSETYPAGRYLEIAQRSRAFDPAHTFNPARRTKIALDFNQSVNPACAYNPNTHCPIAPPENRLPVAIAAGEKRYHAE